MPEPFKLFISHKGEDSDIADKIRQALYELINTKRRGKVLECFLSERITHGQDWLEELHNELHFATFLVLIFTDPDEDWSWCMYEAGYFSALRYLQERDPLRGHASSSRRRTFCLHHPELRPPSPLAHLQATRATEDRVKQMINTLLGDLGIPHSSERDEGPEDSDLVKGATTLTQINEAVARITQCFSLRDAVRHRTPSLRLVIKEGKDDSGRSKIEPLEELAKSLPPESYFSGTDEALRAIFQRSADRNLLPWTDAVETSQAASLGDGRPHYDTRWLVELVDIMYHASNHYYPQKPIHGLVFTGANNVIYSPVIRKISEHRTGTISCDIIFLKWEGAQYPKAPEHIRHLLIAVRMATRFRQEFLEEFIDIEEIAKSQMTAGQRYLFRRQVWRAYYDVLTEGNSRGLSMIVMGKAFNQEGRRVLREMSVQFGEASVKLARIVGGQPDLSSSLVEERSEDDEKFSLEDLTILRDEVYEVFAKVNLHFLAISNLALEEYFASAGVEGAWVETKKQLWSAIERRRLPPIYPYPDGGIKGGDLAAVAAE